MDMRADFDDAVNARILAVSEDQLSGFRRTPFADIAEQSGVAETEVIARIRLMLEAGVIRRVRQTLLATRLAKGALVAWKVAPEKLDVAFDFLFSQDPFSGHVVTRSTDAKTEAANYRLWTTLKVPFGFDLAEHCQILQKIIGAENFVAMPAVGVFSLGVGHVRRQKISPGDKSPELAQIMRSTETELSTEEWRVLMLIKNELALDEICPEPWARRIAASGFSPEKFFQIAENLNHKKVIGRFSTFLEHHKPTGAAGKRVTKFNALFHWAVPAGMELKAGGEVGRHHILTHCYWREAGDIFGNVNIMAVAHGTDKELMLAHKQAIDAHLAACKIPVNYSNVFWGGRSSIKPSEIDPAIYQQCHHNWQQNPPQIFG